MHGSRWRELETESMDTVTAVGQPDGKPLARRLPDLPPERVTAPVPDPTLRALVGVAESGLVDFHRWSAACPAGIARPCAGLLRVLVVGAADSLSGNGFG